METKSRFRLLLNATDELMQEHNNKLVKEVEHELFGNYKRFYDVGFVQGINYLNENAEIDKAVNLAKQHLASLYKDVYIYADDVIDELLKTVYYAGFRAHKNLEENE